MLCFVQGENENELIFFKPHRHHHYHHNRHSPFQAETIAIFHR